MQIAGSECKVCQKRIVFSDDGKFCARCGTCVHLACLPQAECDACGQPLQLADRTRVDPSSDAILPYALRPARSAGPMLAIILAVLLALLVIILVLSFRKALEHGGL
jgi:hypothetical protein